MLCMSHYHLSLIHVHYDIKLLAFNYKFPLICCDKPTNMTHKDIKADPKHYFKSYDLAASKKKQRLVFPTFETMSNS